MNTSIATETIIYPDSDGLPMANNTEHYKRITATKHGLDAVFADRDDVFVAADLFWYPVEGKPRTVLAPDVIVALGRPKGERKSYKQWEEANVAPQVVFEFLSDSNTPGEMARKAVFFERHGVQEYYIYDIERKDLSGLIRFQEHDAELEPIPDMNDWTSPRLGIRFAMDSGELELFKPDGTPFLTYDEYEQLENLLAAAETRAETAETRAETAETRAETAETRAETAETRAETLMQKLRELGVNPDAL
jgi:Uma2 family endonuclease